MKKSLIILLLLFSIIMLHADEIDIEKIIKKLEAAAMEEDESTRHLMLDLILYEHGFLDNYKVEKTESKWISYDKSDPIDDSKICYFVLKADEGESDFGDPVTLVIRATSEKVDLFINWIDYLGNDSKNYKYSEKDVTTRIGKEKAETFRWEVSTDSKATFYPGDALKLIESLESVDQYIAKCIPHKDSPTVAIFNVSGLKEVSMKYNKYLKWW